MYKIIFAIFLSGCSYINSVTVPDDVLDAVARGDSVAQITLVDPPTGEDLQNYFVVNAQMWQALAYFYGIRNPDVLEQNNE